jgi:5-methyltetrahydrofolate--homocysteine methyltransferase
LVKSLSDLDARGTLQQVKARLERGEEPKAILMECRQAMEEVGKRFERCEYFLAELVYAAKILNDVMSTLGPLLSKIIEAERLGRVLIATVKNDVHDIGKNLVAFMLRAAGFDVSDLGVNVSAEAICGAIRDSAPSIVALSCLLTTTLDSMEETIGMISKEALRNRLKIIVGGLPMSRELAASMGADAYGADAYEAVVVCKRLMEAADNA